MLRKIHPMVTTYFGYLTTWFPARSYGFLRMSPPVVGLPVELFVHGTDAPNQALGKGLSVSFEVGHFAGKYKAINVKLIPVVGIDPTAVAK